LDLVHTCLPKSIALYTICCKMCAMQDAIFIPEDMYIGEY
jgi:uncharacterized metal-binding protein